MFLRLHYMDGGTNPAAAIINVSTVSVVTFKPAQETRMGSAHAAAMVTFDGGVSREFVLAEVQDGAIVADLTPSDFEDALTRALTYPGVNSLRRSSDDH